MLIHCFLGTSYSDWSPGAWDENGCSGLAWDVEYTVVAVVQVTNANLSSILKYSIATGLLSPQKTGHDSQ